jgi:hypothetical protein
MPTPEGDEPDERRSRRGLAVVVALVGLAAVAFLAWQVLVGGDGRTPAAAPPVTSPVAGSSSSSTSPRVTTTPATTTAKTTTEATTSAPAPTTPRATTSEPEPPAAPAAGVRLTRALRDYYALLPDDTDEGYALLTDRYRRATSGSQESYEAFWDDIEKVTVRDSTASPPGSVEATLTYTFDDGRVVEERTAYGFVEEDGVLKIDSSEVLSSREL